MKLAYERPVMRAEAFQTNAYCNSCGTSVMAGWVTVSAFLNGLDKAAVTLKFWSSDKVLSVNQYTRQDQYYYHWENNDTNDGITYEGDDAWKGSDYYLEYSAHHSTADNPAFILYKESANSGFYDTRNFGDYVTVDGVAVGNGSNSLQTNTGSAPTFAADAGWNSSGQGESFWQTYNGTEFLVNGQRVHANYWYADQCIGRVNPVEGEYTIENS